MLSVEIENRLCIKCNEYVILYVLTYFFPGTQQNIKMNH